MPVLENALHEKLAQGVARGLTQKQAAIDAGYSPNGAGVSASKALKRPEVAARVAELRAAADASVKQSLAEAVGLDAQGVLSAFERNYAEALAKKDIAGANRALEMIGKAKGLFAERQETEKSGLEALPANQLQALALVSGLLAKRHPLVCAALSARGSRTFLTVPGAAPAGADGSEGAESA